MQQSRLSQRLLKLLRQAVASRDPRSSYLAQNNQLRVDLGPTDRIPHFRRAIELVPSAPFIIDQLGISLLEAGRGDTAELLFESAVARGLWPSTHQRPMSRHVDGLDALPWHNETVFPFAAKLTEMSPLVRREYMQQLAEVSERLALQSEGIHQGGDWQEFVLKKHDEVTAEAGQLFPQTLEVLRNISAESEQVQDCPYRCLDSVARLRDTEYRRYRGR